MAKKRKGDLTPNMKAVLERFSGSEYALPFGKDVRTCEALESRGLLEGRLVLAQQRLVSDGVMNEFRRAYRAKRDS